MSRILAVAALLCVSGMCALIYQVAWIRELRLVFGGATPAAGAVLAVFMGGLGLGNAILGRFVDRHHNPLRLYGLLELAIAVFASLTPFLIDLTRAIYISFGGQAVLGLTSATLVRLGLTALVLALPTIAMGGTLPAAVRAVTLPNDVQRKSAALVYGLNTVGAVFGVVLSTFWLLEALGTRSTIWAAAIMNGGLAFAALHMSRTFPLRPTVLKRENSAKVASRKLPRSVEEPASSHLPRGLVYLVAALVGFAFFLMELVWFRMLTPLLGGTTYTFGVILALVLLGIGLGGLLYPLIFRVVRPSGTAFAITCLLEALCMLVPFALGDELAVLAQVLREQTEHSFLSLIGGWAIVSAVVVFPASLISGIQFPVLLALLGRAEENIGKEVGMAVAANTLGAIAGSLLGGFGLLPWLTAPGVWLTVVAMLALLGTATALREAVLAKKKQRALLPVCLCLLVMFLMREPGPTAAWRHSAIGAGRSKFPVDRTPNSLRQWVQWNRSRIQWEADGADASVAISATDDGVSFLVNGKSDGNAISDAATQIMSGVLAAMLHGHPKTGLVIGLGTGESAGWLAEVGSIEKVDVVEIEPIIEQVARECSLANFDVLNHPKVRIHHNDAREHLFTCQDHYDVVFSEPSNPYRVGIASLFTSEFYQAVQQRLNPGGVLVQWLQCYEIDEETVRMTLETIRSQFPHVEIWTGTPGDLLLVCSNSPLRHDATELSGWMKKHPVHSAAIYAWRSVELESFLGHYVCGVSTVDALRGTPAPQKITDDRNLLEYRFARTLGRSGEFGVDQLRALAFQQGDDKPAITGGHVDWSLVLDAWILYHGEVPGLKMEPDRAARAKSMRLFPEDCPGVIRVWESQPRPPRLLTEMTRLAQAYAILDQPKKARELIAKIKEVDPLTARILDAQLLSQDGDLEGAGRLLVSAFEELSSRPWVDRAVGQDAFALALILAKRSPVQAELLLKALLRPLSLYAFDSRRRDTLLAIAANFNVRVQEAVLAEFEPHVPWNEPFLRARRNVYRATSNSLAVQAERDLVNFLNQQSNR